MESHPIAIIPPRSPMLEVFALAAAEGIAEEGRTPPPTVVTAGEDGLPAPARAAPFVIVGCRTDLEDSREHARRILRELAKSAPTSRHVALFEVQLRGPPPDPSRTASEHPLEALLEMSTLVPPERFVVDPAPSGEFAGRFELDHARRWGARMFLEWQTRLRSAPVPPPPSTAQVSIPRTVPWCGANE